MKKIFAILITLSIISAAAYGREAVEKRGSDEIAISYGQFTLPQVAFTTVGVLGIALSVGNMVLDDFVMPGQLSLEYYHYLTNVIAIGGCLTNDYMAAKEYNKDKVEYKGDITADFVSIMPGIKAQWFNYRAFGMYSKANAGICAIVNSSPIDPMFAFQVSPVCCEFGKGNWRGFLELGFGMQGIATGGLKYIIK